MAFAILKTEAKVLVPVFAVGEHVIIMLRMMTFKELEVTSINVLFVAPSSPLVSVIVWPSIMM